MYSPTNTCLTVSEVRSSCLEATGIGKVFSGKRGELVALEEVNLHVEEGEFVSVIGPSGCGKSTLLNLLAGLDQPTRGTIQLHGVTGGTRLGRVGYMPQRDMLLPWRSILDNVILGLESSGVAQKEARATARDWFATFGLSGFEKAWPSQISGGMRQRAALMRTFLAGLEINLLDEPFGKLDSLTRIQLQQWLMDYRRRRRSTILLITHDIDEAIFLSDRIYVMSPRPGRLIHEAGVPAAEARDYREVVVQPAFIHLKEELLASLSPGLTES